MADYVSVKRIPVIQTGDGPGNYSSFHRDDRGLLTNRVTEETCTHYLYHTFHVEKRDAK